MSFERDVLIAVPFLSQANRIIIMYLVMIILGKVKIVENIDMVKAFMLKTCLFNFSIAMGSIYTWSRKLRAVQLCFITWH